jgi:hypothetical protein
MVGMVGGPATPWDLAKPAVAVENLPLQRLSRLQLRLPAFDEVLGDEREAFA